jgi:hypothetical protein
MTDAEAEFDAHNAVWMAVLSTLFAFADAVWSSTRSYRTTRLAFIGGPAWTEGLGTIECDRALARYLSVASASV